MSQTIKVTFSDADVAALDRDASIQGISRAELVRSRTLNRGANSKPFTTNDYHALVSSAAAFTHGSIDRRQLESVIAFAVNKILG